MVQATSFDLTQRNFSVCKLRFLALANLCDKIMCNKCIFCLRFTVILFCHNNPNFTARFYKAAQDRQMATGTYAWFVYTDFATPAVLQPWTATNELNGPDYNDRLTAYYAINLVSRSCVRRRRRCAAMPVMNRPNLRVQTSTRACSWVELKK